MFATVECEAAVFGCRTIRPDLAPDIPFILALPGADHVLDFLPADRWALLSRRGQAELAAHFNAADLPAPPVVVTCPEADTDNDTDNSTDGAADRRADDDPAPTMWAGSAFAVHHYVQAVAELGADPAVSLSFEDTADGVAAARAAGLQVIGVAAVAAPHELGEADLVVPSLLSVRVLGTHPFIVMEVDAIPDIGTGIARRR